MRLRQVQRPANQASWTEHFYSGFLRVTNGEVETDNQDWINQLKFRGFKDVDEIPEDMNILGKVRYEESVKPQGTQVVTVDTELPDREETQEDNDEMVVESPHEPTYAEPDLVEESSDAESNEELETAVQEEKKDDDFLADMMKETIKRRPSRSRRNKAKEQT